MAQELRKLRPGAWFTKKQYDYPKDSQVWIKGEYDKKEKGYWCTKFSDIGDFQLIKSTCPVYTDFTF